MEVLGRPTAIHTGLAVEVPKLSGNSRGGGRFAFGRICCLVPGNNGYFSLSQLSYHKISPRPRKSVVVSAKKNRKKVDTHSFVPKPDEATGPFPEAVLLKEKNVQQDGRLLPEFADAEERELFEQLNLELESQLNVERMRHYEVVYLIHEDHAKEVESVNLKVQDFIREKKGRIWRFSDWGLRRLAYKIKKAKNAHYILMNFEVGANWINEFKNLLDKDERVIRHLVIKKDKAETEECPPPPEFHTLRAGMDDDEDEDEDEDYDEYEVEDAYEDEAGEEVWDDQYEGDMTGNGIDMEDAMDVENYVDECRESRNSNKPSNVGKTGRMKLRPKKVGR